MVGFFWPRLEQITTKDKVGNAIRTRRGGAEKGQIFHIHYGVNILTSIHPMVIFVESPVK